MEGLKGPLRYKEDTVSGLSSSKGSSHYSAHRRIKGGRVREKQNLHQMGQWKRMKKLSIMIRWWKKLGGGDEE